METSIASLFVVSLTINVCVLSSIALSALARLFLSLVLRGRYLVRYKEANQDYPAFFRRVYLDVVFNLALLMTGTMLLHTSSVLTNPFLGLSQPLEVAFSVFVGWQLFKIFQSICDSDKTAKHAKITCVLRLVAVILYSSILLHGQSALLGAIGLIVEGHSLFFKLDKLWLVLRCSKKCRLYLVFGLITTITALVLRGVFPLVTLVLITSSHWNEILYMDYIPLAVFFLCLVFYTAANLWFIKVSFGPILQFCPQNKKRREAGTLYTVNSTVPNFIHNDLWTGKGRSSVLNLNFVAPSFVSSSSAPTLVRVERL